MTNPDGLTDREIDREFEMEAPVVPYMGADRANAMSDIRTQLMALRAQLDRIESTLDDNDNN